MISKSNKIFLAGHNGMVGSAVLKRLLHEEKFTIKGARQHLKDLKSKSKVLDIDTLSSMDVSVLKKIHSDIESLLSSIKEFKKEL